jgi:hypothetical protein
MYTDFHPSSLRFSKKKKTEGKRGRKQRRKINK